MFGDHVEPDIDVQKVFESVKTDQYVPLLCEGCGMIAIGNNAGELIIAYPTDHENPRENFEWINYKEYSENVVPCKSYDPIKHIAVDHP